ncbi:MAG: D-2-hydroxyacid dehydrogenase [Paracoccaceae bacterium]
MTLRTPTIVVSSDRPEAAVALIRAAHPGLTVLACMTYDGMPALLDRTGAEAVFAERFAPGPYPRAALVQSGVKWVAVSGSGTDHLAPWDTGHVIVTNAAGVAADMMAEYALGAMLAFSLDHLGFRRAQARREWFLGQVEPIAGRTLLIVGLGHTGLAAARRARAMGMTVIGTRARPAPADSVDEVHGIDALPALLPRADFLLLCVPLTKATRGLIGREALALLPPHAVLIDVSRGGVCDQTALAEALAAGRLRGAALDVFESEPLPPESPFWGMENVILTPHCSSVYSGWLEKSARLFSDNLWRWRRGEPLLNIVDPGRGY